MRRRDKLDSCIVWNAHNTVFGCKVIYAQAVYFLHSTTPMPDASVLSCYLFAVFNPGLLFFYVGQPGGTAAYLVYTISYRTSDVAENLGRFLIRSVQYREMTLN